MTDLTLFAGLDVHKKTISVALVDAAASVDAAGDDQAWACPQRGEDRGSGCPPRALRLSWLHVRPVPLSQGRPLVSRGEPVEEERSPAKGQSQRPRGAGQHGN